MFLLTKVTDLAALTAGVGFELTRGARWAAVGSFGTGAPGAFRRRLGARGWLTLTTQKDPHCSSQRVQLPAQIFWAHHKNILIDEKLILII